MEKVSIRPGVNILSVLKHIEYEPWHALGEFVDNAIQSYLDHKDELEKIEGIEYRLKIEIEINDTEERIRIRDNAAGIQSNDFVRAFRAAEIPPNNSGLSEFGMGMKSASCWFSDFWTVKTAPLTENDTKIVSFDLKKIFYDKIEELEVKTIAKKPNLHFTVIELNSVNHFPKGKAKSKIKDHLASIYRYFINELKVEISINGEILEYKEPKVLFAPYPYDSDNKSILWKRDIDFDIDNKTRIKGFVAIREKASTSEAGLALFRRGRVIEGSFDKPFRPEIIFGKPNSFRSQRVFGELHLEGFEVTFTKRGFKWDENMDIFMRLLKDDLTHKDFPLLRQAEEYRVTPKISDYKKTAESVIKSTVDKLERELPDTVNEIRNEKEVLEDEKDLIETEKSYFRDFEIEFNDSKWKIFIELSYDSTLEDWIEVGRHLIKNQVTGENIKQIGIRMSLKHPFMTKYAGVDKSRIEPLLRLAAAIGLSEELGREVGIKKIGTLRLYLNKLLNPIIKS